MTAFHTILSTDRRRVSYVHALLICIVSLAVYANTLHVPFYFDDTRQIVTNPLIKDLAYFIDLPDAQGRDIYSDFIVRIVGNFTFALNYAIHGLRVEGYHIVNILIHIINALLVYGLVLLSFQTSLLRRSGAKDRAPLIALFSALLFASHPVQTQAVTYIVQRLTSLATLFYLLAMLLYVKWRLSGQQPEEGRREPGPGPGRAVVDRKPVMWYAGSIVSAMLAMKTKEIAFTLPLAVTLYELLFFSGPVRKRLLLLTPLLLTLLIIPICHLASEGSIEGVQDIARSVSGRGEVSRGDYLLTQFRVIVTYLRLLILPINQNLDYDYPVYHTFFTPPVYLSFLLLCALFGTGIYLARRSRSSDPVLRLAAFGIFWFFLTLSVESSIVPLTLIFEHRVYLPSVGLFVAATALVFTMPTRFAGRISVLFSLIVLVLSVAGYSRNQVWRDPLVFWGDVVRKSPGKARTHKGLAETYVALGRQEEARKEYETALRLDPVSEDNLTNLMLINVQAGRFDEVFRLFEQNLREGRDNAKARNYVSIAYFRTGRIAEAERQLRISIRMDPTYEDALFNLGGRVLMEQGRYDEAERELRAVLRISQEHDQAHNSLGIIYASRGQYREAEKEFRTSSELNPESIEARNNLAGIYAQTGRVSEAEEEYRTALKFAPENSDVRLNLAIFLVEQKRYAEAREELTAILRLHPDHEQARQYFDRLSALLGGEP